MRDQRDLRTTLQRIDGRGYKAYKDIAGAYTLGDFVLFIDHVQGDPFAAPSRLRVELPWEAAGFPDWTRSTRVRRTATADFLTRTFAETVARRPRSSRGSGKSGLIGIDEPRQEVLERTSVLLVPRALEARFVVGLPARGRSVLGGEADRLLLRDVPDVVQRSLCYEALDSQALRRHLEVVEDQELLRQALSQRGLVAFVGDGSLLPRHSGVDPRPLPQGGIPFRAPQSLAVEIPAPNGGTVRGMGIPRGVTLIVGGGYHGKSTLLRAIELGIYNHIPGDGRETVVSVSGAVKVRAEDGRRVERVDIRPFIRNLPFGRDTAAFSSDDSSGSTSQAANIMEALEVGCQVLVMDEDTSATNFMVRDHRMQLLVAKDREPITPFLDKVRQLYVEKGVSSILVVGGVGDYFDVADTVILMDEYQPREVTEEARAIAREFQPLRQAEGGPEFGACAHRVPLGASLDPSRGRREVKVDVKETHTLVFGTWTVDLAAVEQLVEASQTRTLGRALLYLKDLFRDGETTLAQALDELERGWERQGLDLLARGRDGGLAQVRRFEVAAALNRLRSLRVRRR